MKQELPIAIVLLAAGGILWAGQSGFDFSALLSSKNTSETPSGTSAHEFELQSAPRSRTPIQDSSIAQVSYQTDISVNVSQSDIQEIGPSVQSVGSADITPLPLRNGTADPASAAFLRSVGTALRDTPPFKSELLITLNWSGQPYRILGEYSQPGQGSGQSKIELDLTSAGKPLKMTKVCDGRFLYTHLIRDEKQTLHFIDLRRLQETRANSGLGQIDSPMSWVATGGLASAFENLSAAFEFESIAQLPIPESQTCLLKGRWNDKHLAQLLHKSVDQNTFDADIQWEEIPPQIPQSVVIELANFGAYGWMPQRINFYRTGQVAGQATLQPLAIIEFSPPVAIETNPNDFWKIESQEIESLDITDQYVNQVRDFDYAKTAALESETLMR